MGHFLQNNITEEWLGSCKDVSTPSSSIEHRHYYWSNDPNTLLTPDGTCIHRVAFGTGHSLFENSILPAIHAAESEVIIVTCFWARSPSLHGLSEALAELSAKATSRQSKIRVRICFSSSSLFQNLFHTSSPAGQVWLPSTWQRSLGLPSPESLSGLDMEVKSVFFLPFSVMHPKFVIIDQNTVLLPSCNVSWENWFEGCIELSGQVTQQFYRFWSWFWANEPTKSGNTSLRDARPLNATGPPGREPLLLGQERLDIDQVSTIFLPSPHHRNPNFALPWRNCPSPPPTPLNLFLLTAFDHARHEIYLQTPNLTAPPVLSAILAALKRGVHIKIITSERLMILEQLVTAGTTTKRCVYKLIRRYKALCNTYRNRGLSEVETHPSIAPGRLHIRFFTPLVTSPKGPPEPLQSHLKLTIVDDQWTVFGSGNMDRASWYTSQELGLAIFSSEFASIVQRQVDDLVIPRSRCVFDG